MSFDHFNPGCISCRIQVGEIKNGTIRLSVAVQSEFAGGQFGGEMLGGVVRGVNGELMEFVAIYIGRCQEGGPVVDVLSDDPARQ